MKLSPGECECSLGVIFLLLLLGCKKCLVCQKISQNTREPALFRIVFVTDASQDASQKYRKPCKIKACKHLYSFSDSEERGFESLRAGHN